MIGNLGNVFAWLNVRVSVSQLINPNPSRHLWGPGGNPLVCSTLACNSPNLFPCSPLSVKKEQIEKGGKCSPKGRKSDSPRQSDTLNQYESIMHYFFIKGLLSPITSAPLYHFWVCLFWWLFICSFFFFQWYIRNMAPSGDSAQPDAFHCPSNQE